MQNNFYSMEKGSTFGVRRNSIYQCYVFTPLLLLFYPNKSGAVSNADVGVPSQVSDSPGMSFTHSFKTCEK